MKKILHAAHPLRGHQIIHVSSTPHGGGVAELLKSQIPFERLLGLDSRWFVLNAPKQFFVATKKIHNLLQGNNDLFTEKDKKRYLSVNNSLAKPLHRILINQPLSIVVIHDPQPMPLIRALPQEYRTICRLHIDLSTPDGDMLSFLTHYIKDYRRIVVSHPLYKKAFPRIPDDHLSVIMPAIDPLTPKNQFMPLKTACGILQDFSLDCSQPIAAQISRFDPWKDPLGVINAYYLAKNDIPELKLVLAGFFLAADDPEATKVFKDVKKHAKGDPDIFLFEDIRWLNNIPLDDFLNALYTASAVIIQKSVREGFGLTITEAMWKKKAVIAGKTCGTMLQIQHNKNGILVSSPEQTARALIRLVHNKKIRNQLGRAAQQSVKRRFLFPRYIYDTIRLYRELL